MVISRCFYNSKFIIQNSKLGCAVVSRYSKINLAKQENKIFCDEPIVHKIYSPDILGFGLAERRDFSIQNSQFKIHN